MVCSGWGGPLLGPPPPPPEEIADIFYRIRGVWLPSQVSGEKRVPAPVRLVGIWAMLEMGDGGVQLEGGWRRARGGEGWI